MAKLSLWSGPCYASEFRQVFEKRHHFRGLGEWSLFDNRCEVIDGGVVEDKAFPGEGISERRQQEAEEVLTPWVSESELGRLKMGRGQLVSRIFETMLGLHLISSGELLKGLGLGSDICLYIHSTNIYSCQTLHNVQNKPKKKKILLLYKLCSSGGESH